MSKHIFWLSSYPKSGNTLLRSIITCLFFSEDGVFDFEMLKHTSQFEMRKRLDIIKKINENDFLKVDDLKILSKYWQVLQNKENLNLKNGFGFLKSHSSLVSIYNNWFTTEDLTAGYIYVVRDPRDIAISWAKHAGVSIDNSIDFMIDFKSCIEWARNESVLPKQILPKSYLGSWGGHILSWTENNFNVPKLILKYEDLVYDKEKIINEIIIFFEQKFKIKITNVETKILNIIKTTDFRKLQYLEGKDGFQEANLGSFFRKGEKNQWKKELTKDQSMKIENKFRDFMKKFSYY